MRDLFAGLDHQLHRALLEVFIDFRYFLTIASLPP
jgi:hypothetical protein